MHCRYRDAFVAHRRGRQLHSRIDPNAVDAIDPRPVAIERVMEGHAAADRRRKGIMAHRHRITGARQPRGDRGGDLIGSEHHREFARRRRVERAKIQLDPSPAPLGRLGSSKCRAVGASLENAILTAPGAARRHAPPEPMAASVAGVCSGVGAAQQTHERAAPASTEMTASGISRPLWRPDGFRGRPMRTIVIWSGKIGAWRAIAVSRQGASRRTCGATPITRRFSPRNWR